MSEKYILKRIGDEFFFKKDGHTMFRQDVVKELNQKHLLEIEVQQLRSKLKNTEFKFKVGDKCKQEDGTIITIDDLPDPYTRINYSVEGGGGGHMGYAHWKRLIAI